jgi:hypothetical protein
MTQDLCTCGYQAESPDDLAIHFGEMFIPDNDTASDGQVHNEAAQDRRAALISPGNYANFSRLSGSGALFSAHNPIVKTASH